MPRIFTADGWWAVALPIAILAVLFIGVRWTPSAPEEATLTPPAAVLVPRFQRLPPVPRGHYELWVQRPDGAEERLAALAVGAGGALFSLTGDALQTLPVSELPVPNSTLLVTVEEGSVPAPARSPRILLKGRLQETDVSFEPVLPNVPEGNGALLLAPSDARAPDTAGVWFSRAAAPGKRSPALKLPIAPEGWTYGGFVTTATGADLRTGAFQDPANPDTAAPFSGTGRTIPLPGEDFVRNAPEGVKFPVHLADGRSTLTVSLLPDFAGEAETPFLPLLRVRIPYQQKTGVVFRLSAVPLEELPAGSGHFEHAVP